MEEQIEKQAIEEMIEYLNNAINVERNSYFGKGCMTMPLIEADKILDILKSYRKQSGGEWIVDGDDKYRRAECSNCGHEYAVQKGMLQLHRFPYCPNCGAKMKGD